MHQQKETPSQTAGPYVHIGCMPSVAGLAGPYEDLGAQMLTEDREGAIALEFLVRDGANALVKDAMIEIWHACAADAPGASRSVAKWGRAGTDFDSGLACFRTVKPAALSGQAPHALVWIVARGINLGLTTRVYFPDEGQANAIDPVFQLAGNRAETLLAEKTADGYRHTIRLQGPAETVFFDV